MRHITFGKSNKFIIPFDIKVNYGLPTIKKRMPFTNLSLIGYYQES